MPEVERNRRRAAFKGTSDTAFLRMPDYWDMAQHKKLNKGQEVNPHSKGQEFKYC
jgi:hypothetical protein